ncbi:sulfite exporter TauE/SafE family protein [Microbacterium sp. STN6]|uniref:sulfite exporter TauE/SafE family protein n=1 Tax=Microbacterium sp. STN6 TaxID=2995588 RepID=UPI002260CE9A|nr:sulfite exporter TauE/SafE family protein [Microbacterium sp. STN6]MCX7521607.1 sulfite exporter TauE/SafE family protein [Microbacterium sp. STN6]
MEWFDLSLAIAGALVGFVVGLTGMGGGALMTPMLMLVFKVDPLTAVSSDLVVSLFMKPAGAIVHLRRHTVSLRLVGWLCVGSVPAAFGGILLLRAIPAIDDINAAVQLCAGIALVIGATGLALRSGVGLWQSSHGGPRAVVPLSEVQVRPIPTVLLGAVGGLIVGITSVGAGSIIVVVLLFLYPMLKANALVGTDLVQAIPLVAGATLGHLIFGDISFQLAASLLIGAIPLAWLGAQASSRAPDAVIKPVLFLLLLCSGAKLLGMPTTGVLILGGAAVVALGLLVVTVRLVRRGRTAATGRDKVARSIPKES